MHGVKPSTWMIGFTPVFFEEIIKLSVHHSDNLAALIVDDGLLLLIPQRRHRIPALIMRIGLQIQFLEELESVHRILLIGSITTREEPSFRTKFRI